MNTSRQVFRFPNPENNSYHFIWSLSQNSTKLTFSTWEIISHRDSCGQFFKQETKTGMKQLPKKVRKFQTGINFKTYKTKQVTELNIFEEDTNEDFQVGQLAKNASYLLLSNQHKRADPILVSGWCLHVVRTVVVHRLVNSS